MKVVGRLRRLWEMEGAADDARRPLPRVFLLSVRGFLDDWCFQRAAALAFATLISLMPLVVLFVSFAGMLGGGDAIIAYLRERLFPLLAPDFQDQAGEILDTYISKSAFREGPTGLVNLAAIVGLMTTAMGGLSAAERYFNHIWKATHNRSYLQRMTAFWVVLTTSPFFIALSIAAERWLVPEDGLVHRLKEDSWIVAGLYDVVVPVSIGCLGFTLLLALLPNTKVRLRSALLGGIVTALLWEAARRGFFLYVARASTVTGFYSKLATVPLFMVWVYVSWVIVLFGVEVSATHQDLPVILRRTRRRSETTDQGRIEAGLRLLGCLGAAWRTGKPVPSLAEAARAIDLPEERLLPLATALRDAGHLVEDAARPGRFTFARDPSGVLIRDVARDLAAGAPPADAAASGPGVVPRLARAWNGFFSSFGEETVADL